MKKLNLSRLRAGTALQAVALLGVGVVALNASPAFAQASTGTPTDPTPTPDASGKDAGGQEIVVTGSVIRNPAAASASPIVSLSSSDLNARGINTITDAVQQLPANNAGAIGPSWSNFGFATGASAPSLRGFNDAFTLTIFDGLRTAPYPLADDGYRNFVDINTIPDSIVDRVDVLQDGASSTYGSDAVAGVVNVIVKKQITGVHLNASAGVSQLGDAAEQRIDATVGFGKLNENGYNIYLNGEYQKNDPLYLRDRGYPYNSADLSKVCDSAGDCGTNGVHNGIQADGSFAGFQTTTVPFVRAYNAAGTAGIGQYTLLNPALGCQGLTAYTLTAANRAASAADGIPVAASAPNTVCQQDLHTQFYQYNPATQRYGLTGHFTINITPNIQGYLMANFYETKTQEQVSPDAYANATAPVDENDQGVLVSPLLLPVYVCPLNGQNAVYGATGIVSAPGCTAATAGARLNPNNPFAALGENARLASYYDLPRRSTTDAQTYRISGGLSGSLGAGFNFNVQATHSAVTLDVNQYNYLNAQHVLNALADGSLNLVNLSANSQAVRDYVAPPVHQHSISKLTQVEANISKALTTLPGGDLTVAVGGAYRKESIYNPSSNPSNPINPYDRYYTINTFNTIGSRDVWSALYEVDAPVFTQLHLKAEGRYDSYKLSYSQHGFSYFAPKFEAEFTPVHMLKLRGTFSKGFAVPSIAEASATSTGYLAYTIDCGKYAAFCSSHASDAAYYNGSQSYGVTAEANPNLRPQKSRSFTGGAVFTPVRQLTLTVDYWNTKIDDYIVSANAQVLGAYYGKNPGLCPDSTCDVGLPGVIVFQGPADPNNPTATPLISNVANPYANAASLLGAGIDIGATLRLPLGGGIRWTSQGTASYLQKLKLTDASGAVQVWAGTLSPCNISNCSGAPKWRATWANTLDFNDRASLTLTAYYTSGYDLESTDLGGVAGDCADSIGASVIAYYNTSTPIECRAHATFNADMTASVKVANKFTLYANVLNLLNNKPPFDPSGAYGLYNFNPAWGDRNFIGRYFRFGARVDF